jgi:hypothetical protein
MTEAIKKWFSSRQPSEMTGTELAEILRNVSLLANIFLTVIVLSVFVVLLRMILYHVFSECGFLLILASFWIMLILDKKDMKKELKRRKSNERN